MNVEKFTADNYKRVSKLIDATCSHMQFVIKKNYLYSNIDICNRMAQILAMNLTEPILRKLNFIFIQKKEKNIKKLSIDNFSINFTSGLIQISRILLLKSAINFLFLWSYVFFLFLWSFIKRSSKTGKVILIHGVPASEISSESKIFEFERFCFEGPIKILGGECHLVVQSIVPIESGSNPRFTYARYPLLKAISYKLISFNDLKRFFLIHCHVFYIFFKLIYKSSLASILWRDFGLHSIAAFLNEDNLIKSNVITNTNWLNQFLWMTSLPSRNFETHMVLYSLNSSPLRFKKYPALSPHPSIKYLRADYIYIWHKAYIKVLQKEGINIKPIIVPPILWYLPENVPSIKSQFTFRICIFDVTPMNKRGLKYRGMIGNYYSFNNVKKFILDILFVTDEMSRLHKRLKFQITLKHKRIKHPNFDSEYIDYINDLSLARNNFKIADPDSNLFNLIASHDLALVLPFSSPVFISDYLKVPSIFYDSTGDLIYDKDVFPSSVKFSSDRKTLEAMLDDLISS